MATDNTEFITNMKKLLAYNKMTRKELALQLDVSLSVIDNWLNGRRQPTIDKINALCGFFEVTPNQLLGYEQMPKNVELDYTDAEIDRCLQCQYPDEICNGNPAECAIRAKAYYEGRLRNGRIVKKSIADRGVI